MEISPALSTMKSSSEARKGWVRTWRFIDTGFSNLYMNMAIDKALIQLMNPEDLPILRFFDWSQPAISIGYSQRFNPVRSRTRTHSIRNNIPNGTSASATSNGVKQEGMPFVRRPTGGGVVFHGTDVTYSVVLPKRFDLDIKDTCSLIQSWIKNGLDKLGLKTTQCREIKRGMPVYCSKSPGFGDIMIGDKKVGGLAGRRIRQRMLCQGYVDLSTYGISKEEIRRTIIDNWPGRLSKDNLNEKEEELAGYLCDEYV